MTRRTRHRRRFPGSVATVLACALSVAAQPVGAAVITVDVEGGAQFTTILPAIANAAEGDTILVAPGTYTGLGNHDLDFQGKNLVLTSSHGAEQTIIDLDGEGGIVLENGESMLTVIAGPASADGPLPLEIPEAGKLSIQHRVEHGYNVGLIVGVERRPIRGHRA